MCHKNNWYTLLEPNRLVGKAPNLRLQTRNMRIEIQFYRAFSQSFGNMACGFRSVGQRSVSKVKLILHMLGKGGISVLQTSIFMPPFEEGGAYCVAHVGRYVGRSVGMSVALNLVQLITPERFAPEASNLVGR